MKAKYALAALAAAASLTAVAGPVISLPEGPLYIKFDNREQIAINGGNTGYTGETNWGVLVVSSINVGKVTGANTIETTTSSIFDDVDSHNAQITGIFYDIQGLPSGTGGNLFPATGGVLDLYWRDLDIFSTTELAAATPGDRTSQSTANGFTEGDLLVRILFASGINTNGTVFINGSVIPSEGGFAGLATSYANVDTTVVAPWTETLDGNWFTPPGFDNRDFRFRNIYETLNSWDGATSCVDNTGNPQACVLGARSTDPATAYAVPEPTTLALVGLSLLGLGAARRRKAA